VTRQCSTCALIDGEHSPNCENASRSPFPRGFRRVSAGSTIAFVNTHDVTSIHEIRMQCSTRWVHVTLRGGTSIAFQDATHEDIARQLWGEP
jgi:hypothetical protein